MMEKRLNISTPVQLFLLAALVIVGLIIASVALAVASVAKWIDLESPAHILIITLVQDVLVFIIPAVVCMSLVFKRPTAAMCFDRAPSWRAVALMVVVCLVSIPAMNAIVKWNDGLHLPQFLSGVEQALRTMEDAAAAMTEKLLAVDTVPMLLFSLLVVAFMAGLSEEMLFRGSLLRIWQLGERTNVHVVIWMVAILFSAVHMQFFGFVPRMLLGAYLGYLLLWTRSLWVPIFAHTLNNGMVVVANFLAARGVIDEEAFDAFGVPAAGQFPWLALLSALLTLALLCMAPRILKPAKNHYSDEE